MNSVNRDLVRKKIPWRYPGWKPQRLYIAENDKFSVEIPWIFTRFRWENKPDPAKFGQKKFKKKVFRLQKSPITRLEDKLNPFLGQKYLFFN